MKSREVVSSIISDTHFVSGMGLALPAFLTFICFIIACQASAVMRWT